MPILTWPPKNLVNNPKHAYLLINEHKRINTIAALQLAAALICHEYFNNDHDPLTCERCRRVFEQKYLDLLVFGQNESFKKSEALLIQKQFGLTALETAKVKIYIIFNVDQSSPEAMNALLKFLEEPPANTIAILTTVNRMRVLPTINSRCYQITLPNSLAWEANNLFLTTERSEDNSLNYQDLCQKTVHLMDKDPGRLPMLNSEFITLEQFEHYLTIFYQKFLTVNSQQITSRSLNQLIMIRDLVLTTITQLPTASKWSLTVVAFFIKLKELMVKR